MSGFQGKPIVLKTAASCAAVASALFFLLPAGCVRKGNDVAGQSAVVPPQQADAAVAPESVVPLPGTVPASRVCVERPVICTAVVDRVPQGGADVFYDDVKKLCCFTSVTGATKPLIVEHVWLYKGEEIARVPLKIHSSRWRTHSGVRIRPGQAGEWKVLVADEYGTQLAEAVFEIRNR